MNPTGPATGTSRVVRGFTGDYMSAMTFKRWSTSFPDYTGTWTLYSKTKAEQNREVPYTKYSNRRGDAFRCVVHQNAQLIIAILKQAEAGSAISAARDGEYCRVRRVKVPQNTVSCG
jgi:hypothetical protein